MGCFDDRMPVALEVPIAKVIAKYHDHVGAFRPGRYGRNESGGDEDAEDSKS